MEGGALHDQWMGGSPSSRRGRSKAAYKGEYSPAYLAGIPVVPHFKEKTTGNPLWNDLLKLVVWTYRGPPPSPSPKDDPVLSPCSTIPEVDDPFANVVDSTDPYLNALAIAIEELLDNTQAPPVLSPSSVTLPTRMAPLGADGFLTIRQWEESPLMPRL